MQFGQDDEDQDNEEASHTYKYFFEIENLGKNGTYIFKPAKENSKHNSTAEEATEGDAYAPWRGKWNLLEYNS